MGHRWEKAGREFSTFEGLFDNNGTITADNHSILDTAVVWWQSCDTETTSLSLVKETPITWPGSLKASKVFNKSCPWLLRTQWCRHNHQRHKLQLQGQHVKSAFQFPPGDWFTHLVGFTHLSALCRIHPSTDTRYKDTARMKIAVSLYIHRQSCVFRQEKGNAKG